MGIEPKLEVDYAKYLRGCHDLAYRLATAQCEKSSSRYKVHYDKCVCGSTVGVGDHVLVWNVKIRGKNKMAKLWKDPVYVFRSSQMKKFQCLDDGKGGKHTLHRNTLLPINFLLLSQVKNRTTAKPTPTPRTSIPPVAR